MENKAKLLFRLRDLHSFADENQWVSDHLYALLGEKNCYYCIYWRKEIDRKNGYEFEDCSYEQLLEAVKTHINHFKYAYKTYPTGYNAFLPLYIEKVSAIIDDKCNQEDWIVNGPDPETWTREQLITRVQWLQEVNLKGISERLKLEKQVEQLEQELNGYKSRDADQVKQD